MFLLLVELQAKPSAAAELERVLAALAEGARAEPGTVAYAVHRQQEDAQAFVLYELYRDRAAFDAHLALPAVQSAMQRFEELLTAPPRLVFCDTVAVAGIALAG